MAMGLAAVGAALGMAGNGIAKGAAAASKNTQAGGEAASYTPIGNNATQQAAGKVSNKLAESTEKEPEGDTGLLGTIGEKVAGGKYSKGFNAVGRGLNRFGTNLMQATATMPSDENAKDAEMNNSDARVDSLAKINSYDFTYKPRLRDKLGVDSKEHTGVMAQEIEDNPMFKGCVTEDPYTGYKMLDIKSLTAANTAAIGDLARKINELERMIRNGR